MSRLPVLDSTIQKTHEWLKEITDRLGFPNEKAGFAALRAVLHALRDRLPQENAAELGAQLPMVIRGMYYEGWALLNRRKRMVGMLSLGDIGLHASHKLTGEVVAAISQHPA